MNNEHFDVYVNNDKEYWDGEIIKDHRDNPVVQMAPTSDPWYTHTFNNREELEEFILILRNAANKAWPNE